MAMEVIDGVVWIKTRKLAVISKKQIIVAVIYKHKQKIGAVFKSKLKLIGLHNVHRENESAPSVNNT